MITAKVIISYWFSTCFIALDGTSTPLLEYYMFASTWPGEQGIDGGMTYLLKPRLQLDISAGVSRLEMKNNYFISTGFSIRLESQMRKKKIPSTINQGRRI